MLNTTKITALTLGLLIAFVLPALATQRDELRKEIILEQKEKIILKNMDFTEKEKADFLPVFKNFQNELFPLGERLAKLAVDYVSDYKSLTDKQAETITMEYLDIQELRQAAMRKYFQQLKKILPAKKVFRYLQIENKMNTINAYELVEDIPLAK
jgi:hypothetical protein